jgi:hypothetical protein
VPDPNEPWKLTATAAVAPAPGTPVRAPPLAEVPQYQVQDIQPISTPDRVRYRANVIIPGEHSPEAVVAAMAAAARGLLRERSDARAATVFGYREASETGNAYTLARAQVSRDGRGWTGDGQFDGHADGNRIHVDLRPDSPLSPVLRVIIAR